MFDIPDFFWKHYFAQDFSLGLFYFLTNIGALVLVKRFFNCFHSALLNSIVHDLYTLPIAQFNCEQYEEFTIVESLWLFFVRDVFCAT